MRRCEREMSGPRSLGRCITARVASAKGRMFVLLRCSFPRVFRGTQCGGGDSWDTHDEDGEVAQQSRTRSRS